jgi:hypothetical protein
MRAVGDEEPSGPLLPWLQPFEAWYGLLRQRQAEVALMRRQLRAARPPGAVPRSWVSWPQWLAAAVPGASAVTADVPARAAAGTPSIPDIAALLAPMRQLMPRLPVSRDLRAVVIE